MEADITGWMATNLTGLFVVTHLIERKGTRGEHMAEGIRLLLEGSFILGTMTFFIVWIWLFFSTGLNSTVLLAIALLASVLVSVIVRPYLFSLLKKIKGIGSRHSGGLPSI